MGDKAFDLIVIGAGPGGYSAALRAAQLGLKTACVEREETLGGTCARVGCIPSKALLESSALYVQTLTALEKHGIKAGRVGLDLALMLKRKEEMVDVNTRGVAALFKKAGVTRLVGHARLAGSGRVAVVASSKDPGGSATSSGDEYTARHILIATGSKVAVVLNIAVNGKEICTSTEALSFSEVPRQLAVLGAGAIGLELGSVWNRLGAKVTVLELADGILPGMDREIAGSAQKILTGQGLEFKLNTKVVSARVEGGSVMVDCGEAAPLRCDRLLVAAGRTANTDDLGLGAAGIVLDDGGRIPVDEGYATAAPGIYAIGDVIPGPMLAHKAGAEAVACVEKIVTGYGRVNYDAVPSVVYTSPEIAAVGRTEEELKEAGVEFKKGVFPFRANGRARILDETEGMVKILAHAETDRILGVHIVGARAGDLIAEAVAAIEFGASSEDLALCCHAHPTLSEALKEASLGVMGRALHL
jgi:dihydrolipoamide dehydrogenase